MADLGSEVRVLPDVVFCKAVYDEMGQKLTDEMKSKGKNTLAGVRDLFRSSRKYAMALLEPPDEKKTTRRLGDERFLRS